MKLITRWLPAYLAAVLIFPGCANKGSEDNSEPVEVEILNKWDGDYPVNAIDKLPGSLHESAVGYITDAETMKPVWSAFKPDKPLPEVDFSDNLLVYSRNITYYNRTSIFRATLRNGVLEILARETMSAIPITDSVAISMVEIPRTGIKIIKSGDKQIPIIPVQGGGL
jgi:hypothetical protein